jgi:hypothetical protein
MSAIKNNVFGPMLPKVEVENLPDQAAQLATNVHHISGALQAWNSPAAVAGMTMPGSSVIKTIYRYGKDTSSKTNYWFQFTGDVNIVKGPVAVDSEERTYWTDGTYPKKTKSSLAGLVSGQAITPTSLRMGVPPPGFVSLNAALTFTPVATVSGTATDPDSTPFTSTYVITYLSTWDEESQPSNPSNQVTWRAGQTVSITCPGALAGAYSVDRIRIYRSNTGSSRTTFQFLVQKAVASTTHDDSNTGSLGEGCPTFDWNPPSDGMIGLTDMGNGMMAGFEKNTVYFCEPGYPYAWPAKYDTTVNANIVGIAHFGQTLVVGTTDGIVLLTGADPSAISQDTPKGVSACASKRSMTEGLGGVIYAGNDGLWLAGPGGVVNLTKDMISKEDWLAYAPTSMEGYMVDDRYMVFYDTGTVQGSLVFSFGSDGGFVKCDQFCTAAYFDARIDALFMVQRVSTTNTLKEWNTGSALTATWRSKEYRFHSGVLMARAKVEAAAYPVTFKLYGDGVLKHTQTVTNAFPFVLPAGRNYTISYQIETTYKVTFAGVATSVKELGDG